MDWLSIALTYDDGRAGAPVLDWVLAQGIITVDTVSAPYGLPLLHTAALERCPATIRVLLKHGADPGQKAGRSPEAEAAAALRGYGLPPDDQPMYSPLQIAREWFETLSTPTHPLPIITCLAPPGCYLADRPRKNEQVDATVECLWLLTGKIGHDQPLPKRAVSSELRAASKATVVSESQAEAISQGGCPTQ